MGKKRIDTRRLVLLGLMTAYSLALYLLETVIPNPLIAFFPGAKLGLSNIVTLLCILTMSKRDAFYVLTVRIILSSIFAGPLSYLLFSVCGGYLSLIVMSLSGRINGFSEIGVSVLGAIAHNIGQLIAAALIIENIMITGYLPFMLGASIVTGIFVGLAVKFSGSRVEIMINKMGQRNQAN